MIKKLTVVSLVHLIGWVCVFFICLIERITFDAPEGTESMDYAFSKGIYNAFVIFAVVGVFSALLLFLSMHFAGKHNGKKSIGMKLLLTASAADCLLLYSSLVMVFDVVKVSGNVVNLTVLLWFICTIFSIVMLTVLRLRKNRLPKK